ncbi:MAG: hypothetical protein Aurels2KO_19180 [Aureliella sp.]
MLCKILEFRMLAACAVFFAASFSHFDFSSAADPATDAAEAEKEPVGEDLAEEGDLAAGHSFHGETFNEGPRQAAYLMAGLSGVSFPATTNAQAQRFIDQGVAQLHGFWYYEAERSFRQAAVFDPECAIAYWGMAAANIENRKRARGFIAEAVSRKDSATKREQLYIEAMNKVLQDEDDKGKNVSKKDRAKAYTKALEQIVKDYPDDIEARAFLALQLWHNSRADLPIVSHVAVNSVLQDVFDTNPSHPAHHYRIHLWDREDPAQALASAAQCGQSLPAIAHMWHMPGHIYSKLHRYNDAAWQQEASARVDHAHMMRDRVLPDQIHNFAHNNEWLIRNLVKLGRVDDALGLAKNMLELPRHPKYNMLSKRGSANYGRQRLILTLKTYRLWDELLAACQSSYLPETGDEKLDLERLGLQGFAASMTADEALHGRIAESLQEQLSEVEAELKELTQSKKPASKPVKSRGDDSDEAKSDSGTSKPTSDVDSADETKEEEELSEEDKKKAAANRKREKQQREAKTKKLRERKTRIERAVAMLKAADAAQNGDYEDALKQWKPAGLNDELLHAEWYAAAGQIEKARELVDEQIEKVPGEVLPPAVGAWIEHQHGEPENAEKYFKSARAEASSADLNTPLLARLQPLATKLGIEGVWAIEPTPADDLGDRPNLDSLGPFRWKPYKCPDFEVVSADEKPFGRSDIDGQPTLVIFYLGFGCLHCVEQLHEFSPRKSDFVDAGINLVAISTENIDSLNQGLTEFGKPLDIPLHSDPNMVAFRSFRCYDDFESQPLHGTFLIGPDGSVLWQDISYEPFMDVDFALKESKRLLELHRNDNEVAAN